VKLVSKDFVVDDAMLDDFRAYLDSRKLRYTPEDLSEHREEISHRIEEQVLMQVFGEGEAKRRTLAWDPQVKKALELVPQAELLLRDPKTYIAERQREGRVADAGGSAAKSGLHQ
jgi:carboxyl-terminal processing protease